MKEPGFCFLFSWVFELLLTGALGKNSINWTKMFTSLYSFCVSVWGHGSSEDEPLGHTRGEHRHHADQWALGVCWRRHRWFGEHLCGVSERWQTGLLAYPQIYTGTFSYTQEELGSKCSSGDKFIPENSPAWRVVLYRCPGTLGGCSLQAEHFWLV